MFSSRRNIFYELTFNSPVKNIEKITINTNNSSVEKTATFCVGDKEIFKATVNTDTIVFNFKDLMDMNFFPSKLLKYHDITIRISIEEDITLQPPSYIIVYTDEEVMSSESDYYSVQIISCNDCKHIIRESLKETYNNILVFTGGMCGLKYVNE